MSEENTPLLTILVETYNINILDWLFNSFTAVMVVFGGCMRLIERHLPNNIRQSFRYGKHAHKGTKDKLITKLEIPKSWFKHFYIFAFAFVLLALFLQLKCFITHEPAADAVVEFLDVFAGGRKNRRVKVDSNSAFIGTVLFTMQCGRRFYETNFVQIFSKKSKINFTHYTVGYLHYFGAILALLANTEGFIKDSTPSAFSFGKIGILQYIYICVFHLSWMQQYKANMILVNLRKDAKSGKVATEKHLLPKGGFFELVSSPHMLFEMLMYLALLGIFWQCTTWYWISLFVCSNQLVVAFFTHDWYIEHFKDYPKKRRAIIPYIL